VLLTGNNPIFAVLVIGTVLAAIIFSREHGQRTKMVLGGIGIAAAMAGLALLADAFL
jgi:hypothetical protein